MVQPEEAEVVDEFVVNRVATLAVRCVAQHEVALTQCGQRA